MILERYIHKEILSKLVWILGLLLLIMTSHRFVSYLADAAEGQLPSYLIFRMLGVKMLSLLPRMLPVALFISVILAMARLNRDRELTVVSSAGVADRFQLMAVFRFALAYGLVVAAVSFYLAPWAELQLRDLNDQASRDSDVTGLHAGQFKEFNDGNKVVYVRQVADSGQTARGVFLQVRQENGLSVIKSDSAQYRVRSDSGSRYVLFQNGRRYVGEPGDANYEITRYGTYAVLLDQDSGAASARRLEAYPTAELWRLQNAPGVHPLRRTWYKAELQWRLSYVLTTLLLPLLGVALSRWFAAGDQRYMPLFFAILIYFVYSNLLGISKTLLIRGKMPLSLGLWWVHALLLLVIIGLLEAGRVRFWFKRIRSG